MRTKSDLNKIRKADLIDELMELQAEVSILRKKIRNLKAQVTRAQNSRDTAKRMWAEWRYKALRERKGKMAPLKVEKALTHALRLNGYKIPTALPLAFVVKDYLTELERIYVEEL
tara:strand:- start:120 stop:464 length:345 start_codon:yes stop_codon:yes gene_type:complete